MSNSSTTDNKEVLDLTVRIPPQDYNPQQTKHLVSVALEDIEQVLVKDQTYRGSWHRRGGVGAFMMLARKWDRLETILSNGLPNTTSHNGSPPYDILKALEVQDQQGISGDDGSVLAEIRDLRRYLLLVETYFIQHKTPYSPPKE